MHAKTTVLKQVNTLAPKRFMDINIDNQQAIFVERLRTIDDLPVVLDQDYLLTPPVSSLPAGVLACFNTVVLACIFKDLFNSLKLVIPEIGKVNF